MTGEPTPQTATAPKRRRHLMDPNDLQRHSYTRSGMTKVQQWVLSTLAVSTVLHLVLGLILAAATLDGQTTESQIGLMVVSAALGVGSVALWLAIHRKPMLHWSLALGVIPALIGAWYVL